MPPRKSRRGKVAPPKKEEKVEEVVTPVEDTTEDTIDEVDEEVKEETVEDDAEEYEKLSPEEKLERIGNVAPSHLFERLLEKMNHPRAYFDYDTVGDNPKTMKCTVHFMSEVCTVENVKFKKWKSRTNKAKNVCADYFLKHLYGEDHTLDARMDGDVKHEITEDVEWWTTKKEAHLKRQADRSDRIVKKISENDKMTDEKKAEQTARVEAWKVFNDELPAYEDLHAQFDYPYGPILLRSCRNADIKYLRTITKLTGGKEEEMESHWKIPRNFEVEEGVEWKVRIDIKGKKGEEDLMAYEAESEDLHEACSTAAYSCLQQLLEENHIKRLVKSNSELARINPKYTNIRTGRRDGRHRRGVQKMKNQGKAAKNDKSAKQMAHEAKQAMAKMQKMMKKGGGMQMPTGGAQMVMMPVMMNANGQMVIMGQQASPTKSPKKKNKKRKGGKNSDEPAEKVSAN